MKEFKHSRPVGYERYKKSSGWTVKVAEPNVWMQKNKLIWEAANGPIPEGYNLRYKDGDNRNCTLENLVCISKGVHIMLNETYKDILTPDNIDTVIALAQLNDAIHKTARDNGLVNNDGTLKSDKKEMDRIYHSTHKRVNGRWVPID